MLAMRYNDTKRNMLTFKTKTNAFFIEPFSHFFHCIEFIFVISSIEWVKLTWMEDIYLVRNIKKISTKYTT